MPVESFIIVIAAACLAGEATVPAIADRIERALGKRHKWHLELAARYTADFDGRTRPRRRDVVRWVRDTVLELAPPRAANGDPRPPRNRRVREWLGEAQRMQPVPSSSTWPIPVIENAGALAEWLGVTVGELEWFADLKALGNKMPHRPALAHYHYRVVLKRSGGIRLIEAPQPRLRALQRKILTDILDRVPAYYDAAHGFVKGRSIRTFAAPHVGQRVVLRLDLQDFFPSISGSRVQAAFRTLGYPEAVADLLGGICTNSTPRAVLADARLTDARSGMTLRAVHDARVLYRRAHLPQGAPTSPALANLCAYHLDCRITGLADWAGAVYTRYADDLAFSGGPDVARNIQRYAAEIAAIVLDEGWSVQHHKTRVMPQSVRQHLAGLVTNTRLNVPRSDFDRLKATLVNCTRTGPALQNREGVPEFRAHLAGRVAFVTSVNSVRGAVLRAILDRIDWS
ncbi:MAG TPA: reverse transcriptase family protein [Gemmatimonas sp.]|nr:reverse transcriptase family protein [Gemmatimonas sp.]